MFSSEAAEVNKHDGKSRNKPVKAGRFTVNYTSIEDHTLKNPSFLSLPYSTRFVYLILRSKYNGNNADSIQLSYKEAESIWGINRKTLSKAFKGLLTAKLIIQVQKGGLPLYYATYSLRGRLWGIQEEIPPPPKS